MEALRSQKLDNLCESIGDVRDVMNEAKRDEKNLLGVALEKMQGLNLQVYKHGRVELVRVPGSEKLRARVTKDDEDLAVPEPATDEGFGPGAGEEGGPGTETIN
jgi:hypothetical protein